MRVLVDENLPVGLAAELVGHSVETVNGLGWSGIKNGDLLRRVAQGFEALITMETNLEIPRTRCDISSPLFLKF